MPFYLYEKNINSANNTIDQSDEAIYSTELEDPNLVPVFLVPSVYGDGNEFQYLIARLQSINPKRPIYFYKDEMLIEKQREKGYTSLTLHGKSIAKQIASTLKTTSIDPVLIGYSYGCMLAAEAAKYLSEAGADPHVYLLDGIERETSKQFYTKNKEASTPEISIMVNMAAKMLGLSLCDFTDDDINSAKRVLNIKERANYFYNKIVAQNKPSQGDVSPEQRQMLILFKKQFDVICQNLQNLSNNAKLHDRKLRHITAILTRETTDKAKKPDAGWRNVALDGKITLIHAPDIAASSHLDLVRDASDNGITAKIARVLSECFAKDITVNSLANRTALNLLKLITQSKGGVKPNTIKITYGSSPTDELTVEISSSSSSDKDDSSDDYEVISDEASINSENALPEEKGVVSALHLHGQWAQKKITPLLINQVTGQTITPSKL